jgi:hypothetical protein
MSLLPGRERADFKQERAANDWYWEQSECIRTSFRTVQVEGAIHDPACGSGRIPTVAREFGYKATGSDLVDRGYGFPTASISSKTTRCATP